MVTARRPTRRPRSRADISRQGPDSKARRAATTARSTSATPAEATCAIVSSVAGLTVWKVSPPVASHHSPPMNSRVSGRACCSVALIGTPPCRNREGADDSSRCRRPGRRACERPAARAAAAERAARADRLCAHLRLALGLATLAAATLAFGDRTRAWWILPPLAAFIVVARRHEQVLTILGKARRGEAFHARGLARLRGAWPGSGDDGSSSQPASHPYAEDLDILGPGSLFQRLGMTGSAAGRRMLAAWLLNPATPVVVRSGRPRSPSCVRSSSGARLWRWPPARKGTLQSARRPVAMRSALSLGRPWRARRLCSASRRA